MTTTSNSQPAEAIYPPHNAKQSTSLNAKQILKQKGILIEHKVKAKVYKINRRISQVQI